MAKPNHLSGPLPGQTVFPDQTSKRQHCDLERIFFLQRFDRPGTTDPDRDDAGPTEPRTSLRKSRITQRSAEPPGGIDN
jgi:hypothetical protein